MKSFLKITIEGRAIYGNLENKINTFYWPVENVIPKNNDRRCAATKRCRRKITEGQCAVLYFDGGKQLSYYETVIDQQHRTQMV